MTTETREEQVARWERDGLLDPTCAGCQEFYRSAMPTSTFAPSHKASDGCQSGKRHHCTCDRCF